MSELAALRSQAAQCTSCELHADATQTVFGSGHPGAAMALIGEQPGDREDIAGKPFVGPAGRVLDRALEQAGIARSDVYVTNVVKHFRFRREGKVRIHRTPGAEHVRACLPWLHAELAAVGPRLLVTLGATAAKALLGTSFRLTQHRGELLTYAELPLVATIHPSALLRGPKDRQAEMFGDLVAELELAGRTAGLRRLQGMSGAQCPPGTGGGDRLRERFGT
jgi:uracil-DNA glycosylase